MNPILKSGLVLGIAVELWVYILGFVGWHTDPVLLNLFWIVVLISIGVLIWGLKQTAPERAYGAQVGAGVLMSIVGGAIIMVGSILFTSVVFPSYFVELRIAMEEMMRQQGVAENDIQRQMEAMAPMQTPLIQALQGFIGTVVTGLFASLIIAIFIRKKEAPVESA